MEILLEPTKTGYRATANFPVDATTEGETAQEAVAALQRLLSSRLKNGAQIIRVDAVDTTARERGWFAMKGSLGTEPLFDAWIAAMEQNRREADENDAIL